MIPIRWRSITVKVLGSNKEPELLSHNQLTHVPFNKLIVYDHQMSLFVEIQHEVFTSRGDSEKKSEFQMGYMNDEIWEGDIKAFIW